MGSTDDLIHHEKASEKFAFLVQGFYTLDVKLTESYINYHTQKHQLDVYIYTALVHPLQRRHYQSTRN